MLRHYIEPFGPTAPRNTSTQDILVSVRRHLGYLKGWLGVAGGGFSKDRPVKTPISRRSYHERGSVGSVY